MKSVIFALMLFASLSAHASTASANHGHHGGGNNGAVGAAAGAFGGSSSSSAGAAAAGASGMGGSYWSPDPNASLIDGYQPWPQREMKQFQKP
ncbi:hypothetical protein VSR82_07950 [Burkholderia sp. JPY481]